MFLGRLLLAPYIRGVTSCHLELGGLIRFAWGGPTGSGEGHCCLGLGEGSGTGGEGATGWVPAQGRKLLVRS